MKKNLVFGQVIILVLGIIAISYAVGSEVGVVNGEEINLKSDGLYNLPGDNDWNYKKVNDEWYTKRVKSNTWVKIKDSQLTKTEKVRALNILEDSAIKISTEPVTNKINARISVAPTPADNYNYDMQLEEYYLGGDTLSAGDEFPPEEIGETLPTEVEGDWPIEGFKKPEHITTDPETGKSEWSFYLGQHLFGTNAKNTVTYNENTYFYELADDGKTKKWYEVSGGDRRSVSGEVEAALNAGKGKTVGGGSWTDAGKNLLAKAAIAEGAKALAIAMGNAVGAEEEQAAAIGEGVRLGVYAAAIVDTIAEKAGRSGGYAGAWVGVAVALWYIAHHYKDTYDRSITFECSVWEAPKGGTHCQDCNNAIFGCSEYQCKSLGKGCELLNPGTDEELCSWVNRNDAEAPEIRPNKDAISKGFQYTDDNSISPPNRGVQIIPENGSVGDCVEAYTPLTFGVSLDEPATCKVDVERKDNYEDMSYYFGASSNMKYNHTHIMTLPSIEAEGTVIQEGANMSLFVRCEDANGNSNEAEYLFNFCVEQGDDFTPPYIVETSIPDNSPVQYNISSTTLTAYINEQVDCKWDFINKRYDLMNNTFSCSNNFEVLSSAQTVYPCTTTLTGIKDRAENDYYIRCNDTSGNENKESTELTLIGTQPLYIDFAEPNDTTVKEATSPVPVTLEVKTSSGADDGKAFCYYKPVDSLSYVQFLYSPLERTHQHTQELNLAAGAYGYDIKCTDAGGNDVFETILFDVEVDSGSPVVIRAYREEGYLKLITDESGECVYNNDEDIGCKYEFDDGIAMQTVDEDEHFVEWDSQKTYYIKCKDEFDNPPAFSDCSIVARPSSGQTL